MARDYYDRLEQEVFERVAQLVGRKRRIVDIGCGDGHLANYLAKKTLSTITCVDIDPIDFLKGIRKSRNLKTTRLITFSRRNAETLSSYIDGSFDVCVTLYVLHELKHPRLVIREARRVLKRKGMFFIIDFPRNSRAEKLYDEKYYTIRTMTSMLQKEKFGISRVEVFKKKELALVIGEKQR